MYHDLWIKESNITLHSILDIFQSKFNYIGIHYGETFTFHSGYIPMPPRSRIVDAIKALHSILDIFQYGGIRKVGMLLSSLHSILDIFQFKFIHLKCLKFKLYIPFWIYSNLARMEQGFYSQNFTFHSGYIPIQILLLPLVHP